MRRVLLTILTVGVVLGWIVVSYTVETPIVLIAWPAWATMVLAILAAVAALLFLALQGWIVVSTDRALVAERDLDVVDEMHLSRGRELFLALLPVGMTLVVVAAAWGAWAALI